MCVKKLEIRLYSGFLSTQTCTLRRLPTVQPIFGHLGNTSALINMSYFFQFDMKIASVEYIEAIFDTVSVTIAT